MRETTLYFVRHGETDYNRQGIVQGKRINSSLNETGRMQARALGRRFKDVPVDAFYSSTLRRAEETLSFITAEHPDVPVYRLAELDEISWGVLEGKSVSEEVLRVFDDMNNRWKSGEFHHRVDGGESILDVQERALRAVEIILERHSGGTVIIVTHGRFLRILLATLLDGYGLKRMHEIQHSNTAVNMILCDGSQYEARFLNCTAHLDHVETLMVE